MVFPYDLVKEDNLFFNGYINSMLNELDTVKVDDSTRLDSTRLDSTRLDSYTEFDMKINTILLSI